MRQNKETKEHISYKSKSLKENFIEILKAKILSGELKPGDKLPPEREIAKKIGISRGSVNQGILELERMGFLRIEPRQGTFVAEYGNNATPETLAAIMSYDSSAINSSLFRDFMDFRILVERECTRLACINLTSQSLDKLNAVTSKLYLATKEELPEDIFQYHKCVVEISNNKAYLMIFQSFEKMIHNLITEHFKDENELAISLPKYQDLTNAITRRDAYEADIIIHNLLGNASNYLNVYLKNNEPK